MKAMRFLLQPGPAIPVLLTFLAYIPTLGAYFFADDWAHILLISDPDHNAWAYGTFFYRPLFLILFGWFYQVFGMHASLWHAAVLLLHLANVALVYTLARRLGFGAAGACAGAALFGVFPRNVEAVSWLCAVSGVMAAFFCLLSVHAALTNRIPIILRGLLSIAIWTLALLSKEEAAGLIFILPLIPILTGHVKGKKDTILWEGCCLLLPVVLYGFIHIEQQCQNLYGNTTTALSLDAIRHGITFANWWVSGAIWPGLQTSLWLASFTALIPIFAWIRYPLIRPGILWFTGTALPIGMALSTTITADRYAYLPSIGIAICMAALVHRIFSRQKPLSFIHWLVIGILLISLPPINPWGSIIGIAVILCSFTDSLPTKTRDNAGLLLALGALIYRESGLLLNTDFPTWAKLAAPGIALAIALIVDRCNLSLKRAAELALCGCILFWADYPIFQWFLPAMISVELARMLINRPLRKSENPSGLKTISYAVAAGIFIICLTITAFSNNTTWYKRGLETRRTVNRIAGELRHKPGGAHIIINAQGLQFGEPQMQVVCAKLIINRPDLRFTISGGTDFITATPSKPEVTGKQDKQK